MSKNIVVRLSKEHTYRHLHMLCQNDTLFTIIDYPDGWQDKDYERIVISDAEAIRSGTQRAVIGTVRLLPYDNGTAMMFFNKDAIWHNEISEFGEKLFSQYIERVIEHFTEFGLILHKSPESNNKDKMKASNLSSSQKKLSKLRDELVEINMPSYPDNPYVLLKNWVAKATPIIRIEWAEAFDDFNSLITMGGWTKTDMATYVDIVTYGNVMPHSNEHRQAWNDDVKEVQVLRQKFLNFLDGLLLLSPKRQPNSSKNNPAINIYLGDNSSVGNLVVSRSITKSFNKIESSESPDELKRSLQELTGAVNAMMAKMPTETAEQVARDLEMFVSEAVSKSPRPQWYQLSIDGLKDAAKNIGEIGLPVLKLAAAVLALLSVK